MNLPPALQHWLLRESLRAGGHYAHECAETELNAGWAALECAGELVGKRNLKIHRVFHQLHACTMLFDVFERWMESATQVTLRALLSALRTLLNSLPTAHRLEHTCAERILD